VLVVVLASMTTVESLAGDCCNILPLLLVEELVVLTPIELFTRKPPPGRILPYCKYILHSGSMNHKWFWITLFKKFLG
jgi:hypothetical protein